MGFQKQKLVGTLGVGVGRRLQLTPEQAGKRKGSLKEIDKKAEIYEVIKPVEFKAGEVIGVEFREVPKADYPALGIKAKDPRKPMAPAPEGEGKAEGRRQKAEGKEKTAPAAGESNLDPTV